MINAIKEQQNGKASSLDTISTTLVKDTADIICQPLTMGFDQSLEHGVSKKSEI